MNSAEGHSLLSLKKKKAVPTPLNLLQTDDLESQCGREEMLSRSRSDGQNAPDLTATASWTA